MRGTILRGITGPVVALGVILAGCAVDARLPGDKRLRVWPPPPDIARIELLGEIRSARDVGLKSSSGFLRFLGGEEVSGLKNPYAIAVTGEVRGTGPGGGDAPGPARIAVTDTATRVVHLFDLERTREVVISRHSDTVQLESPVAVAFDAAGALYVCDSAAALLLRYDEKGDFERILARGFGRPSGLAVDPDRGVIYVADAAEHVVRKLAPDGRSLGDVAVPFRFPTHLAIDGRGRLVVSDSLNFRAVVLGTDGSILASVGGPGDRSGNLQRPKGVALDRGGHLYAVDAIFDNVQIFDLSGRLLLAFGSAGGAAGEFALPAGIVVDSRNLIYVADTYNGRIQIFRLLKGLDE